MKEGRWMSAGGWVRSDQSRAGVVMTVRLLFNRLQRQVCCCMHALVKLHG